MVLQKNCALQKKMLFTKQWHLPTYLAQKREQVRIWVFVTWFIQKIDLPSHFLAAQPIWTLPDIELLHNTAMSSFLNSNQRCESTHDILLRNTFLNCQITWYLTFNEYVCYQIFTIWNNLNTEVLEYILIKDTKIRSCITFYLKNSNIIGRSFKIFLLTKSY